MSDAAATVRAVPRTRLAVLVALAAIAVLVVAWLPPIAQDPAYHRFADARTFIGIPNAANVLSSLGFIAVGVVGLGWLRRRHRVSSEGPFAERWEVAAAIVFASGIALTGVGSMYYHWAPDNARLVWDRLPMTLMFMSLFALVLGDRIAAVVGRWLLGPLLAVGVASVGIWHASELAGRGDLRLYALVQFLPTVAIPLLLACAPGRFTGAGWLWAAVGLNALGKVTELGDHAVLMMGGLVSGHTAKHLLMAVATACILRMLVVRRVRSGP
jgi:hypothetical protein